MTPHAHSTRREKPNADQDRRTGDVQQATIATYAAAGDLEIRRIRVPALDVRRRHAHQSLGHTLIGCGDDADGKTQGGTSEQCRRHSDPQRACHFRSSKVDPRASVPGRGG